MLFAPWLIYNLPGINREKKGIICYVALLEMATCLQGTQTNAMVAALILGAFVAFEKKCQWLAAFAIAAGFYIKVFPIVALSLFILYPDKINFLLKFIIAFLLLGALPLLFISPAELAWQYHNWLHVLVEDSSDNYGKISLTGFFQSYFNLSEAGKLYIQLLGIIIFCTMYVNFKLFKNNIYRYYFLSAMLIWVAIFNHAAEIYSYAIAIWGVGIWFVLQPMHKLQGVFIGCFIFFATILSIDPTPRVISDFLYHHSLKALPFTIVFLRIVWQLWQLPRHLPAQPLQTNSYASLL